MLEMTIIIELASQASYPTHDYIRMEITVLSLKFHGINCRFNGRKYPFTGSANASPSKLNLRPSNRIETIHGSHSLNNGLTWISLFSLRDGA
jgi:hypothetical protein